MVERTTKRTTCSTTSAAVPTGRDGSGWIPKEWTFHSDTVADKFDRHVREQLSWYDLATQAVAHALIAQHERIFGANRIIDEGKKQQCEHNHCESNTSGGFHLTITRSATQHFDNKTLQFADLHKVLGWLHRLVRCGRRYHPRGAIGLPLRINKTSDMANMSSPTGQTIRASSSAKKEISGTRIGCGRSAMKSAR